MFRIGNDWRRWMMLAPDGGEGGGDAGGTGEGGDSNDPNSTGGNNSGEKTFTQEQVNSMIAAERRKSTNSIYKSLGFESEEAAKEFVGKYKQEEEKNKTDLVKAQEAAKKAEAEKAEEAAKAQDLQYRFDAISEGADPKSAADVVVLAKVKMSDDKDFATALKEVKEQYPAMFGQTEQGGGGTGGGGTPPRKRMSSGDVTGIGKRLAEQRKQNSATKDDKYFK